MTGRDRLFIAIALLILCLIVSSSVSAGKLYIKASLERNRAERLLDEADTEFRHGTMHITYLPDVAIDEFRSAKRKFLRAIDIIMEYGEGYYTPGDVDDFQERVAECDDWVEKCRKVLDSKR